MKALKRFRQDGKTYNGFIFRVEERDLPGYLGHFVGATTADEFEKPIRTLEELGQAMRQTVIWRIGESTTGYMNQDPDSPIDYMQLGKAELRKNPDLYRQAWTDAAFMEYIFEDYQLVLSRSIPAKRILRVIPPTGEFGRVLYRQKKQRDLNKAFREGQYY
ncbi:hypothetical protein FFV09_20760 [Saccharibacillus brassicae]|uniref:Uncharacterized protein n=2 Tax=Saccharibacillus brassicae TaxID=2583377 RepID=A0A4Y6V5M4_SACBS|nr:hypothetical protein FFV09_20760 [Saccharibacillus brassicae]